MDALKRWVNQYYFQIVLFCLVLGTILRFLWPEDMEWKSEELWMFEEAHRVAQGGFPLPPGGIMSSVGIPNPGMSLWCFALIAKFTTTPIGMVQGIMFLNVVVLWCFFGFIVWQIPRMQQSIWLWGLAIASVNPIAIIFSRKIWIPDLLAPFCLLCFLGHSFRQKFWGAFLWGCFSLCSGQIHMSGLFLTVGLTLWTIWHDWRDKQLKKIAWSGWFLGSVVASVPLIYWLIDAHSQLQRSASSIVGLLVPKFYMQWLTTAIGVNLSISLKQTFWSDFLQEPRFLGMSTYLMIPVHAFLLCIGLWSLYQMWQNCRISRRNQKIEQATIPNSSIKDYIQALGFGLGGIFTITATDVIPHYVPITFPFPFLWLANIHHRRPHILLLIVLMQLWISITFLQFIHDNDGCENCDYGRTYRSNKVEFQSYLKTTPEIFR
ncbi:MAG: hypothetical protein HC799_17725 [Limnothrix sp. RL_2_0]|nr:hypothetical protein [Limnothrix sp. RL_2_0]